MMGKACDSMCKDHCSGSCKAWAILVLRIALGVIMVMHGYDKLFGTIGMEAFTGMVAKIGFPMAPLFAYISACTEFFGGLCILLGLFTRISGALIAFNMFVAWSAVKGFGLPKGDIDLALLAMGLSFALSADAGAYSVDAWLRKNKMMGMGKK